MTHNSANPQMETNTLKLNYELSQNVKIIFGTKLNFTLHLDTSPFSTQTL